MKTLEGKLAVFVQPKGSQAEIQGVYLTIENFIDGREVTGDVEFSVDEETRKSQTCKFRVLISHLTRSNGTPM